MRKTSTILFVLALASASPVFSQVTTAGGRMLRLTVDEAVRMALEHNVDLAGDRLDPQIGDARVAAAAGAFRPAISSNVLRNNQLQPPANLLTPTATRTDVVTSTVMVPCWRSARSRSFCFGDRSVFFTIAPSRCSCIWSRPESSRACRSALRSAP